MGALKPNWLRLTTRVLTGADSNSRTAELMMTDKGRVQFDTFRAAGDTSASYIFYLVFLFILRV